MSMRKRKERISGTILLGWYLAFLSLCLCGCTGAGGIEAGSGQTGEKLLTIVMYHSIVDSQRRASAYIIRPKTLEEDLAYLKEHGYSPTTVQELYQYVHGDGDLPDKTVLITFDDGYFNNLSYAVPLLEQYGYNAVISVVGIFSDFETNTGEIQNNNYSYLTWQQIGELGKKRFIEIGNHSYNMHGGGGREGLMKMTTESDEEFRSVVCADVEKVQQMVRQSTGTYPAVFTYPYGRMNDAAKSVIESMGFQATLSCYEHVNRIEKGTDCLYDLGRYNRPSGVSSENFFKKMTDIR